MAIGISKFLTVGAISCYFCRMIGGVFHSVHEIGLYGDAGQRIHYHPQCLELVELYPTAFPSIMVDKALVIEELKQVENEKINASIIPNYEKKIQAAKQKHFENMMPTK